MLVVALLLVVALAITVGIGFVAHRAGRSIAGGPWQWGLLAARRFGQIPGAALCLVAGLVGTGAVMAALGPLAKELQHPVDDPVFHFVRHRVSPTGTSRFDQFNNHLTLLGDRAVVDAFLLVGVLVLMFVYGRRWWVPVSLLAVITLAQYEGQVRLAHLIDRGYPPVAGSGTYPSGGVSRLIADYGTIAVLVVAVMPALSRRWRARTWTGVMFFGVLEAYTRLYLSQHWLTDALAGLVFGGLLLVTVQSAVAALTPVNTADAAP